MSQSEIFRTAIAAKLKGDDAAFTAAIKEAIKEKTKALLGESEGQPSQSQSFTPWYEQRGGTWLTVDDVTLPEGLVPGYDINEHGELCSLMVQVDYQTSPEEAMTRDHPGSPSEMDFQITEAQVCDYGSYHNVLAQISPETAQRLLSDQNVQQLEDQIHSHHEAANERTGDDYGF